MYKILIIEDQQDVRKLIRITLDFEEYEIHEAPDADVGHQIIQDIKPDLIVLDVMMPGETGLEFATELRRTDDVPILMLTAMVETKDRIAGLERGVDDYLGKPFEPRELLLRIQSVLRRGRPAGTPAPTEARRQVTFGPMQFDIELGELTDKGKRLPLTDAEIALMRAFAGRIGEVLSRETLCKIIGASVNERAIDVQVTRLRRKIEPDPSFPRYLRTVRGQGYRLVDA